MAFDEVTVLDATSLDVVARAAQVREERIRQLNPQYVRAYAPVGEARTVRVPAGGRFERRFASVPADERLGLVEHLVAPGETFTHIARRYGVSVSELTDTNRHVEPRLLQIGMTVIVPLTKSTLRSELRAGG